MNQRRIIFFSIFGAYHLVTLLFTIYMDAQKQDFGMLTKMLSNISLFKYGALIGVILLVTDFIWTWRDARSAEKVNGSLQQEVNTLKAKVYDFQESEKRAAAQAESVKGKD